MCIRDSIVPLDTVLNNGDIVEILTTRGSGPSRDWLKIVKTSQAKNKIRQWFRKEGRDEHVIQKGRDILEKEAERQHFDVAAMFKMDKLNEIAKKTGYVSPDDLFVAISEGAITPIGILSKIKEDSNLRKGIYVEEKPKLKKSLDIKPFSGTAGHDKGVWVKGEANVMVKIANCCKPLPGDPIIGYITSCLLYTSRCV